MMKFPLIELPREFMPLGFDFGNYFVCEQQMIKPLLERAGHTEVRFFMGERDSFGPLSRIVEAMKGNELVKYVYS